VSISTFLDSSVLFGAYRGRPPQREPSLAIVNDPGRSFIASPFLYLETMPKAIYHRNTRERDFYATYFDKLVRLSIDDVESIVRIARAEAERCGIAAMDALHVAAAYLGEAEVLYTLERRDKPIYRTTLVRVVSVEPEETP
jgi:predicted nucleic acid-binding protein